MRNESRRVVTGHDAFQFQALSVGIGIGDLVPPGRDSRRRGDDRFDHVNKADISRFGAGVFPQNGAGADPVPFAQVPEERGTKRSRGAAKAPRQSNRATIPFRLLAYGLDLFFVALTLATALALATVLSAVRTGETDNWLATKPIQWLAGQNPYTMVGGVYAAFFAYALLFKLLAGSTLGEGLLGVSRKKNLKPVKA